MRQWAGVWILSAQGIRRYESGTFLPSTAGRNSLSGSKRRTTFENKKIPPAKLAGQLRYAVLAPLELL
jgi:hypothetical protein